MVIFHGELLNNQMVVGLPGKPVIIGLDYHIYGGYNNATNHPFGSGNHIPPIKMVMTGGWFYPLVI